MQRIYVQANSLFSEATGSCSLAGTTQAVCTASGSFNVLGVSTTTTDVYSRNGDRAGFHPVTITAGAEKLADVTPTATVSETGTGTGTQTDDAGSETETGSESDSGNAAMPLMTGYANWVVGGGAMAVALAAM